MDDQIRGLGRGGRSGLMEVQLDDDFLDKRALGVAAAVLAPAGP